MVIIMGLIYKRKSPSGKYYIGKTTGPENIRWNSHVSEALNPNSSNNCLLLNNAIRKYGRDSFTVEILEDNIPSEQLADKEAYYIEKYHAYYLDPPYMGYNMTKGGEGALKYSDEEILQAWKEGLTVQKISNKIGASRETVRSRLTSLGITQEERIKRGVEQTSHNQSEFEEYKEELLILYREGKTVEEICKILRRSENTITKYFRKLGITKEEALGRRSKRIYQIDIKTNKILNIFCSCAEAARNINNKNFSSAKTLIATAARNSAINKTAYGYKWIYEEDYKGE